MEFGVGFITIHLKTVLLIPYLFEKNFATLCEIFHGEYPPTPPSQYISLNYRKLQL